MSLILTGSTQPLFRAHLHRLQPVPCRQKWMKQWFDRKKGCQISLWWTGSELTSYTERTTWHHFGLLHNRWSVDWVQPHISLLMAPAGTPAVLGRCLHLLQWDLKGGDMKIQYQPGDTPSPSHLVLASSSASISTASGTLDYLMLRDVFCKQLFGSAVLSVLEFIQWSWDVHLPVVKCSFLYNTNHVQHSKQHEVISLQLFGPIAHWALFQTFVCVIRGPFFLCQIFLVIVQARQYSHCL